MTDTKPKTNGDGPFARVRGIISRVLHKLAESPLTDKERKELRRLAFTPPGEISHQELLRADALFEKARIPNVPMFLQAFMLAKKAEDNGQRDGYLAKHREKLKATTENRAAFHQAVYLIAAHVHQTRDLVELTTRMTRELERAGKDENVRKYIGERINETLKVALELLEKHEREGKEPPERDGPRRRPFFKKRLKRPADR